VGRDPPDFGEGVMGRGVSTKHYYIIKCTEIWDDNNFQMTSPQLSNQIDANDGMHI